jgi:hypothetical protein
MSLLPQHKKSAGEIAKLRETLGIHDPSSAAETPSPDSAETSQPAAEKPHSLKPVHSLKRSERTPVLAVEADVPEPAVLHEPRDPKQVRSLRKSEQVPLSAIHQPAPDSTLPIHRHSDEEIQQIRRQESLAALAPAAHLLARKAHPVIVIPGYLFAIASAVGYHFYDLQIAVTAACVVIALLFAAFIYFKKPLSLHHAAFIAVMSLFVIVFGALYYFPQLRHGT